MLNIPIQLRPYQFHLIQAIYESWRRSPKVMAQLATGGGKTVIFSVIADEFIPRKKRVLVLVHREELLFQAADKLESVTGMAIGIIKAGMAPSPLLPIQVASVQTLVNRLGEYPDFGLVVIDEAHHSTAKTYRKILEAYPNAHQLGVTATPIRTDGTGFRDLFDEMVTGPTVKELIDLGHLSQFKMLAANPMETKGVRTVGGDYSAAGLEKANDVIRLSGDLVKSYQTHCPDRRCLVFAFNVAYSMAIADRYNAAGIPAIHLDGETPSEIRKEALRLFSESKIKVISNCGLFGEGLDIPALEAVQIARPTKSLGLWLQMVGRALRPAPGKDEAILIDHTKNYLIHGLPTRKRIWSLDGVEHPDESEKQKRKPKEEVESVLVEVIEEAVQLTAIAEPTPEEEWSLWLDDLIAHAKSRGYKDGWIYYRLIENKPPLPVFQRYAKMKGYHYKWAHHKYREAHGVAA